jgi:CheY-like chemotaxis protein
VNLCDVVARAADVVRPAATAKGISVTVQEPSGCRVHGDPERLQQVFWNLLSNAVKFTPAGGSIDVEIAREAETITVAVVDTGVGIPPAFLPFVFDRFRQADQTSTRTHGGLGLGLSIVKHLTELHGGVVTASSGRAGRGARFEVRLPASEAKAQAEPVPSPRANAVRLDGHRVLVVDDDDSTREVLSAALERAGARVCVAGSAAEARKQLEQRAPTLIIADLGMPGEDGFSFVRGVRQSAARDVPAIALSAYADPATRTAALDAGFSTFLAKPARPDTLLQLVAVLLGGARGGEHP